MKTSKQFHISQMLSVTTGILLTKFGHMQEMMIYVLGIDDITEIGARIMSDKVEASLRKQHPWLNEVTDADIDTAHWQDSVAALATKYGEYHELIPVEA